MNVAIIPARAGSQRIPGKNKRWFHGKPIFQYSLDVANKTQLFDQIIVSTDDVDIAEVTLSKGHTVHPRNDEHAQDHVPTIDVARNVVDDMPIKPEKICVIYATAPMLNERDLVNGWVLLDDPFVAHVISVGYPPLCDAGMFYWSNTSRLNEPYFGESTRLVTIDSSRVCDINDEVDWQQAERMYAALKKGKAWSN